MIRRDYFLREIHRLTQAVAGVLFKKQQHPAEARAEADAALRELLHVPPDEAMQLPLPALIEACTKHGTFSAEYACLLADLLDARADLTDDPEAARAARERALGLYQTARATPDAALPMDLLQKIRRLKESVDQEND